MPAATNIFPGDLIKLDGEVMEVTGKSRLGEEVTFELESGYDEVTYAANRIVRTYEDED